MIGASVVAIDEFLRELQTPRNERPLMSSLIRAQSNSANSDRSFPSLLPQHFKPVFDPLDQKFCEANWLEMERAMRSVTLIKYNNNNILEHDIIVLGHVLRREMGHDCCDRTGPFLNCRIVIFSKFDGAQSTPVRSI